MNFYGDLEKEGTVLSWTGDPGNCGCVLYHLSQTTFPAQKIEITFEAKNLATYCQKNPAEKNNQMDHVVQKLFFTAALFFNSFESNSNPRKRVDTRLRFEMQSTRSHAKITGLPLCELGPRRFFPFLRNKRWKSLQGSKHWHKPTASIIWSKSFQEYPSQDPKGLFQLCHDATLIKEFFMEAKLCTLALSIKLQFSWSMLIK